MAERRCPGQDMRYWKPEDIFTVHCPHCQAEIEFWKDEPFRLCLSCQVEVRNPKQDFGCAQWCRQAQECLGAVPGQPGPAQPISHRILAAMAAILGENHSQISLARRSLELLPGGPEADQGSLLVTRAVSMLRGLESERPARSMELARRILATAGVAEPAVEEICQALAAPVA